MKVLFQLSHPAHFHLFKNVIKNLEQKGHTTFVLIKTKDVLQDLLDYAEISYYNILPKGRKNSKLSMLWGMFVRDYRMWRFSLKNKPDVYIGSTVEVAHMGWLLGKYSIIVGEDDAAVVPAFGMFAHPFAKEFLSPICCNNGKFDSKSIKYNSYHELAYLHPNHFVADKQIVEKYFSTEKPYFLIRFAKLTAHHDDGIRGISTQIAEKIIEKLLPHGDVYITSERELEHQFEKYRIKINPLDIHHIMAFAEMYIGDSQTMAAEAAVLGVPFIRFNDFVGRIGYLKELEEKYELGFGVTAERADILLEKIDYLVALNNRREVFQQRKAKMLSEKIDYAQFLTWFVDSYPDSSQTMKTNPDYQYRFK